MLSSRKRRTCRQRRAAAPADACRILPLSAQSPAALEALVNSWTGFLAETPASIDDLCHTAGLRRTHYDYRIAVTGHSKDELRRHLEAFSTDTSSRFTPPPSSAAARRVRLLWTGTAMVRDGARTPEDGDAFSRRGRLLRRAAAAARPMVSAGRIEPARRALAARGNRNRSARLVCDPGRSGGALEVVGRFSGLRHWP